MLFWSKIVDRRTGEAPRGFREWLSDIGKRYFTPSGPHCQFCYRAVGPNNPTTYQVGLIVAGCSTCLAKGC